jgi:two-component system probable response regulator PhcQ
MNGVEFLARMIELQPKAPRVIISGFADRDAIISAINEASLTRFIEKPWNDEELRRSVVSILGGTAQQPGANRSTDLQLRRMERESPGITQVERDDDGGIVISPDDLT